MASDPVKEILGGSEAKKSSSPKKGKKRPKHRRTEIDHLDDGSHVITHHPNVPDDGSKAPDSVKYSARDLDGLHDGIEENLGEPNVGEEKAGV